MSSNLAEPAVAARRPAAAEAAPRRKRFPFSLGEEVFIVDEGPAGGIANMECEIRVSGSLDEARLRAALDAAVAVHPMIRARLARPRVFFRAPLWEIVESVDTSAILEVAELDEGGDIGAVRADFCNRPIDLREAPALRALLVRRPGGDSLLVLNHHATCDGVGALRFLNSVARAYAGRPDPVPADVDPVAARDKFRSLLRPANKPPRSHRRRGRTAALAVDGGIESIGLGIQTLALSAEEVAGLNPKRFGAEVTLNDMLLAAANLAVDRWNADRGQPCDLIKVSVPSNLRPEAWRFEVVANIVHLHLVSSTPEERSTPRALFDAIAPQTRRFREGQAFGWLYSSPPWVFWTFSQVVFPLMIRRHRRRRGGRRPGSTILLSNRGRVETKLSDFGPGGQVTEFWSTPPCTRQMGFSIGINILHGRILLSMRHRLTHLDAAAARAFFDLFREQLLALNSAEV